MDWSTVISALGTIAGIVGGSFGFIYWKENKRLKQEEVKSSKIENHLKQADAWRNLYEEERNDSKEKIAALEEKLEKKSAKLKEVYAERDRYKEEKMDAEFIVKQLQWFRCTVNGCHRRRPPHVFDNDGNEVETIESCTTCAALGIPNKDNNGKGDDIRQDTK